MFSSVPRPCKLFIEQNNREANSGHDWFCAFKHGFWLFYSLWSTFVVTRMCNCQLGGQGEYTNRLTFTILTQSLCGLSSHTCKWWKDVCTMTYFYTWYVRQAWLCNAKNGKYVARQQLSLMPNSLIALLPMWRNPIQRIVSMTIAHISCFTFTILVFKHKACVVYNHTHVIGERCVYYDLLTDLACATHCALSSM